MTKLAPVTIAAALLWSGLPGRATAAPQAGAELAPEVQARLAAATASQHVAVIVTLREQPDLGVARDLPGPARRREVVRALRARAGDVQRGLSALLQRRAGEGRISRVVPLWIFNGLAVTAAPEVIRELTASPLVRSIEPDEVPIVPAGVPAGAPEANVAAVKAPDLWSLGLLGRGAVVGILDSGVDVTHPDLAARYRGGTNSWFDPYGQHPTPYDRTGHGTWTAGVVVGGDAGGTAIGTAPEASFIAARVFNDAGSATATAIHQAFQWMLDPDGDPATDDAPDVVNASWVYGAPGCNLAFQADLRALRAAGITPVFAAGNFGPSASTSASPANYPEALSVGAASNAGVIASDSSRGPSACGGGVFPTVVAPGVELLTSDLFSLYASVSGTSVAAPHVSGALALLRSGFPGASMDQIEAAVLQAARDLGPAGADGAYGYGYLDVLAAYQRLAAQPAPSPPVALDDAYTVAEDTAATFTAPGVLANDTDPDGRALTASLVTPPASGALTLQPGGALSYVPSPNFFGLDSFSYRASDGALTSNVATVRITVTPVNDAPVAAGDAAATTRTTAVTINVLANDRDVDGAVVPSTVTLAALPRNGTATRKTNGTVIYTPSRRFVGTDSFSYTVKDDAGATSNAAVVTVQVR